jgi:hypothetical protein
MLDIENDMQLAAMNTRKEKKRVKAISVNSSTAKSEKKSGKYNSSIDRIPPDQNEDQRIHEVHTTHYS